MDSKIKHYLTADNSVAIYKITSNGTEVATFYSMPFESMGQFLQRISKYIDEITTIYSK
jgi:hypothetical protein